MKLYEICLAKDYYVSANNKKEAMEIAKLALNLDLKSSIFFIDRITAVRCYTYRNNEAFVTNIKSKHVLKDLGTGYFLNESSLDKTKLHNYRKEKYWLKFKPFSVRAYYIDQVIL